MIWVRVDGEGIEAFPKGKGICDLCGAPLYARCGDIKVWHWAHYQKPNCDNWQEPETKWHYHWKMTFGKDNSEIIIERNGIKHRADVLTKNGVVIELQNSPIQNQHICQREQFYGEKMLWVVNGIPFRKNFVVCLNDSVPQDDVNYGYRLIWDDEKCEGRRIKIDNPEPVPPSGQYCFSWNYNRQSWYSANRPVFIDFGGNNLFWVRNGMGGSCGDGDFIPKEKFIEKYGGNYNYFQQNHETIFQDKSLIVKKGF